MPLISVIIPVYNTATYLAECLDSVLNQTFTDWEAICIDDGSTDNSLEILKEYAKKDKRIKILTQKNQGVVIARNNGIKHAAAELIYPLDSDDIIDKNCLAILYNKISTTSNRVVASEAITFGKFNIFFTQPKFTKYQMYGYHECCIISALFYKSDFERFGGYKIDFNGYGGDDMDYWLNYIDNNLPILRVPNILFFYRTKEDNESAWKNYPLKERQKRYEHKEQLLRKYHPKMKKWILIYNFLHSKFIRFIYRKIEDNGNTIIKIFKIPVFVIKRDKRKKLYYFDYRPNFGDLLNIDIFKRLSNIDVVKTDVSECEIVAIGSVFGPFFSESKMRFKKILKILLKKPVLVWGTGFIEKETKKLYPRRRLNVKAVRGFYTLERLKKEKFAKISKTVAIGDPGLLASMLIDTSKIQKKYDLGIIPHYVDQKNPLLNKINVKNSIILDITEAPEILLPKIAECKNIISSAMHGLIVSDSLGIPNIRMILSDKIFGGDYKFNDYYSVFGIKKHNRINLNYQTFSESDLNELQKKYTITQEQVHKIQKNLINQFPYTKGCNHVRKS